MPACFRLYLIILFTLIATGRVSAVVYVDASATGTTHNGKSWKTAYLSITQAITSITYGGDIWVKAGIYRECVVLKTYVNVYGGFFGYETTTDQRVLSAFPTIIDAAKKGRGIDIPNGAWCIVDGVTVRNGIADEGGGIRCDINCNAKIRSCKIESCRATSRGGGVYFAEYAQGIMNDCTISNCTSAEGGGLVVEYHCYPTMQRNLIYKNSATTSGGGVFCPFHSGAQLQNSTIAYNTCYGNGGGIYVYYGGPVTLEYCILAFNSALSGGGFYGGGGSSQAVLTSCNIYGNIGGDWGGSLPDATSLTGNYSSDPVFVNPDAGEFAAMNPASQPYEIRHIGTLRQLPIDSQVILTGKIVNTTDGNITYIQEVDRISGVAVVGMSGCTPGDLIGSITGTLSTNAFGNKILTSSSYSVTASAVAPSKAIGVRISSIFDLIGVRTRTWGKVAEVISAGFVLKDGVDEVTVRYAGEVGVGDFVIVDGTRTIDGDIAASSAIVYK